MLLRFVVAAIFAVAALMFGPFTEAQAACPPSFTGATISSDANCIFRDYSTDGDSGSGVSNPIKSDIRKWADIVARGSAYSQFYVVTDPRWGTSLCSGVACPIGTGGDDSVPLNAISAACQAAHSCGVIIPPGVKLNVCSAPWNLPSVSPVSMVITGNGKGSGGVQVLPGCGSPPASVIHIPSLTVALPAGTSDVHYTLQNLRIDGKALTFHDIQIDYTPIAMANFTSKNVMYRNVKPGLTAASIDGGSNVYIGTNYQASIDDSNSWENLNDQTGNYYGVYSAGSTANYGMLPPYGVNLLGYDSNIGIVGTGAAIAGIVNRYNPDQQFNHAHSWGYPATNGVSQPFSSPQYNFITRAGGYFTQLEFDSPAKAGLRAQGIAGASGVDSVTAVTNAGSGGTPGAVTVLTGTTGTGTKWKGVGIIGPTGALASIPWVTVAGNYSVNPSATGEVATATNGLSNVTLNLQMGASASGVGPVLTNVNSFNAPYVFELGAGLASFVAIGNDLTSHVTGCVSFDAGATMPRLWGFDNSNLGCDAIQYSIPTNSGTCHILNHVGGHNLLNVRGSFTLNGACAGTNVVFDMSTLMPSQTWGYACTAGDLTTPSSTVSFSAATTSSVTFTVTAASGDAIYYDCDGF